MYEAVAGVTIYVGICGVHGMIRAKMYKKKWTRRVCNLFMGAIGIDSHLCSKELGWAISVVGYFPEFSRAVFFLRTRASSRRLMLGKGEGRAQDTILELDLLGRYGEGILFIRECY